MASQIVNIAKRWRDDERGMAAVEAALVFPVMLVLFLGVFDLGSGILANQKTVRASQVMADLVSRHEVVDPDELSEIVQAGYLALEPLSTSSFGLDIVSIRFTEDETPEIVWQETRGNITATGSAEIIERVSPLSAPDSGVVMVVARYNYVPKFSTPITGVIDMQEVAFTRGRTTPVVCDVVGC